MISMISLRSWSAWMAMAVVILMGVGSRSAVAQTGAGAGQSARKLPADVLPESLSRLPWATRDDMITEEEKQAFDKAQGNQRPPSIGTGGMRAYFPLYGQKYIEAHQLLDKEAGLGQREVQLAILVAAREMVDQREWFIHERAALQAGASPEIIDLIRTQKATTGLPVKDEVLVRFSREMLRGPNTKVSSQTFADMERAFGRRGTVALAIQVSRYAANAILNRAYDMQLTPDQTAPFPLP